MGRLLKILVGLFVVSAAVLGAYGWLRGRDQGEGGIKFVDVASGSITDKAVAVGQIEPRLKYHVKSKISGIVKRCNVEVGQAVRAGDPLFEIVPDPTPAELIEAERRVQLAEAAFERARADNERAVELGRSGIVSRDGLDAKLEAFEQARITFEQAQDQRELLRKGRVTNGGERMESVIRAPAGGTVLERLVNPGDPVVPLTSYQAGTDLATIADMSDLIFKGTVDEIDVGKLKAGLPVRFRVGALPEAKVSGRLNKIAPQAREKDNARLFEVDIELDRSSQAELRAGYSANADVIIREKKDVLLVPERVVTYEDGGKKASVEVPGDGPKDPPKKVEVKTGLSDGLNVEVVSGLKAGDKVVQRPPKEIQG
jgi:HlyD family secretion protein